MPPVSPLSAPPDNSRAAPSFIVVHGEDAHLAADRFVNSVLAGSLYKTGERSFAAVYSTPPAPRKVYYFSEPHELIAIASFITNVEIEREGQRGVYTIPGDLPRPLAEKFLRSSAFDTLPALDAVFTSPRIVLDSAGPRLHEHGYEARTRSIYLPVTVSHIEPSTSTEHLTRCFAGMPFRTEGDRNRFFGWLLGSLLYDPDVVRPLLVVEANSQRAGKSSLCYAAGRILDGREPISLKQGPELEKRLAALLTSNDTFGFLDNVVSRSGSFDSTDLSSILTTPGKVSIRRLCSNTMISGGGLIFAMTINDASLSRDLTTRSVPVSLEVEEGATKAHVPYAPEYAAAHRIEILSELIGLALSIPTTEPRCTSRFVAWERFVRPRIASAFGDTELGAEFTDSLVDSILRGLVAFGIEHLGKPFALSDLADAIIEARESTVLEPIQTALSSAAGPRGKSTKLSHALRRISDGPIRAFGGVFRVVRRAGDGPDAAPTFTFEEVTK